MTKWQRINAFFLVLLQLLFVALLLHDPANGKAPVLSILKLILVFNGIRFLALYFSMARFMVGGKAILYKGVLLLNLGFTIGSMESLPSGYVTLYLIGYFILCGLYRCLKVLEAKKIKDSKWILFTVIAVWYLSLAVLGIRNLRSESFMVYLFCVEMTVSAMNRLVRVFRRTAIVYIP